MIRCLVYIAVIYLSFLGGTSSQGENHHYVYIQRGIDRVDLRGRNSGDDRDFAGQIVGSTEFLLNRYAHDRANIEVYSQHKKIYVMPDEMIDIYGEVFKPGESYEGYDFYLSHDQSYLCVVRGIDADTRVCYLYRRRLSSTMKPVLIHRLRFDEAALQIFAKHEHLSYPEIGRGKRIIDSMGWVNGTRQLRCAMFVDSAMFKNHPSKSDVIASWSFTYDLNTRRFRIIGKPEIEHKR